MYSAYVSRQIDRFRQSWSWIFMFWENFQPTSCCETFLPQKSIADWHRNSSKSFQVLMEGEWFDFKKKKSYFAGSPSFPAAQCNTCLISRSPPKGWASRNSSPWILHASFFIHAARNVPSLAQLHLNTPVLPNTWLDFPLSKWKISIICFLRIQQMREFMTNCVGLCRIVIIRYKWEFFA